MKIAVIPARGGSKRIPRKNIRPFAGRPIIGYSIAAAEESGIFDEILVSTDDPEIAAVSRELGASTPFARPAALSDDHATTTAVIAHAAQWALEQGWRVEALCCVYATAPLVRARDLVSASKTLLREELDFVFAAGRFSFPVERALRRTPNGRVEAIFPEHRLTRSQDLAPAFHDAGQFYWGKTDAWIEQRPIFGDRSSFVCLPPWRIQDIDTEEDWRMAEFLSEVMARYDD